MIAKLREWKENVENAGWKIKKASRKGQYFTFDVILAGIIMILAIILLINYWRYALENSAPMKDNLTKEAIRVSNLLFTTRGKYAIIQENSTSILKPKDEIMDACKALNGSTPYHLYVVEYTANTKAFLFGHAPIRTPQDKVVRAAYDGETGEPVVLEIYVTQ